VPGRPGWRRAGVSSAYPSDRQSRVWQVGKCGRSAPSGTVTMPNIEEGDIILTELNTYNVVMQLVSTCRTVWCWCCVLRKDDHNCNGLAMF